MPTLMLREMAMILLKDTSYLTLTWVKREDNKRADTLSRDDMNEFMQAWEGIEVPWVLV